MPRPSRNLDRALIAAGRALLPSVGCAGLTIRQVCEAAGVNIGMFHYHFKTREAFVRAVMQETYDQMFHRFSLEAVRPVEAGPEDVLRSAFRVIGRFLRDNHQFIARVWADAMCGDPVARDFLRDNIPRHGQVILALIAQGQASGALRPMPLPQALGFCMGAIVAPLLFGGAMVEGGGLPRPASRSIANAVLSEAALDERIDLALAALAAPARAATTPVARARAQRRKKGS